MCPVRTNVKLARAVGFEPTIPGLESGALGLAKLRPYLMLVPGDGIEPPPAGPQPAALPLSYRREGFLQMKWSRRVESNNRPSPYEGAALDR